MELQKRSIPFEVRSGLKFFEMAHIKDILSFLRVVVNPFDELSWKRIVRLIPGIGSVTAGKLWDSMSGAENPFDAVFELQRIIPRKALDAFRLFLELMRKLKNEGNTGEPLKPSTAIEYILKNGYEDYLYSHYPNAEERIEDIEQMTRFSMQYTSIEAFVSDLSLLGVSGGEIDEGDTGRECVILSTVHQAKGLEWNNVFVIGLTDGRFPSIRSLKSEYEEEERRLFYVAITRAREELYLSYPIMAQEWHGFGILKPSRFIRELPKDAYEELIVINNKRY